MTEPLGTRAAGIVCDLDGVVYAGAAAIPHAVEALGRAGCPVVYATNNASRTPASVAEHLRDLGLELEDEDVLTSSVVGAARLAELLAPGESVLAVGGPGVAEALRATGLLPRKDSRQPCAAVLQGYGADVTAQDLAEAAFAIQGGARWVATNVDATLPTDRGQAPGNGSLVGAVRAAVDTDPEVVGKPHPPMYLMAAERLRVRPERLLALGDRLETDIAGACAAGTPSALVLTGVHTAADAAAAPREMRPTYLLTDLRGLHEAYPDLVEEGAGWFRRGEARARVVDGGLEVGGASHPQIDAMRAGLDAVWHAVDVGDLTSAQARDFVESS